MLEAWGAQSSSGRFYAGLSQSQASRGRLHTFFNSNVAGKAHRPPSWTRRMTSYVSELKVPPLLSRHAGEVRPEHPHEGKQLVFAPPEHLEEPHWLLADEGTHGHFSLGSKMQPCALVDSGVAHGQVNGKL